MNQNRMLVLHLFLYSCLLAAAFAWIEQRIEIEKRRFAAPITELQRRVETSNKETGAGIPSPPHRSVSEHSGGPLLHQHFGAMYQHFQQLAFRVSMIPAHV